MTLDKSNAPRRRWKRKGNSYEKEIDIPPAATIRGEKQEHLGGGVIRPFRAERADSHLAICRGTSHAALRDGHVHRATCESWDSLVKSGPFDNE